MPPSSEAEPAWSLRPEHAIALREVAATLRGWAATARSGRQLAGLGQFVEGVESIGAGWPIGLTGRATLRREAWGASSRFAPTPIQDEWCDAQLLPRALVLSVGETPHVVSDEDEERSDAGGHELTVWLKADGDFDIDAVNDWIGDASSLPMDQNTRLVVTARSDDAPRDETNRDAIRRFADERFDTMSARLSRRLSRIPAHGLFGLGFRTLFQEYCFAVQFGHNPERVLASFGEGLLSFTLEVRRELSAAEEAVLAIGTLGNDAPEGATATEFIHFELVKRLNYVASTEDLTKFEVV